ncbi:MAG: DUF1922 domain-containing protein [Methanocorpusculum sp.]|nr:DUF1922 domain-containing protein [Methanocorpusculum sp.]
METGFAVVGCLKCRRKMVADVSCDTKTCQCGAKINLKKTKLLFVSESAEEAGNYLRKINSSGNSGFSSAEIPKGLGEDL